jgi:hypothetical protein
MKSRISTLSPSHTFQTSNGSDLYFADYTDIDKANGIIPNRGAMFSDVQFPDYAFPKATGGYHFQCECSIFPDRCNNNDWILFIETKYAKTPSAARTPSYAYLKKALIQIVRTVTEYRKKGVISNDKPVYGIVSFPILTDQFNELFFQTKQDWVDRIKQKHNILIRGINSATIRSEEKLKLRPIVRNIP